MTKLVRTAFACLAWGVTAAVLASPLIEGDPAAGKRKAQQCAACHGADGNSGNAQYPKLAGQHAGYLYKQLKAFKGGERENAIMKGQVAGLSEADMRNLAVFYARQDVKTGSASEGLADQGERLYRAGDASAGVPACMGCHGPAGKGNPAAHFPALAGQHAQYVVTQLQAFKDDERTNDAGQMMRNIADKMDAQQMKAVASYIEGLH